MNVGSASENAVSSVLGVRFASLQRSLFGKLAQFNADLAWEHRLNGGEHSVTAAFSSNPGGTWQAFSTTSARDTMRLSLGGSVQASKTTAIFGKVVGELGDHTNQYGVQAGVQWKW